MRNLAPLRSLAVLGACWATLAVAAPPEDRRIVDEVADVERAFAAMFQKEGWSSFSFYAAEDGVFPLDKIEPAKPFFTEFAKRAEGRPRADLQWWPAHVEVACSNDLAWSTGPTIRKNRDGSALYSDYVTVWRLQADGTWRWIYDRGVGHDAPVASHPRTAPPSTHSRAYCKDAGGAAAGTEASFLAAEDALNAALAKDAHAAWASRLAPDSRVHRFGFEPFIGKDTFAAALAQSPWQATSRRLGHAISKAGDLAYAYGDFGWIDDTGKARRAFYLRVWRKAGPDWNLVLDQINPIDEANQ